VFKQAVYGMLLSAGRDKKGNPYHPESMVHALPIELLVLIIKYLASEFSAY